ncbi:MAG: hypothetical protein D6767_03215 [Candidatus Hydrogenedentota bacterium]|nr:MAG: hypothetical protein D6767_03215 [Candidatus Hydrogenedentota bacterium]
MTLSQKIFAVLTVLFLFWGVFYVFWPENTKKFSKQVSHFIKTKEKSRKKPVKTSKANKKKTKIGINQARKKENLENTFQQYNQVKKQVQQWEENFWKSAKNLLFAISQEELLRRRLIAKKSLLFWKKNQRKNP